MLTFLYKFLIKGRLRALKYIVIYLRERKIDRSGVRALYGGTLFPAGIELVLRTMATKEGYHLLKQKRCELEQRLTDLDQLGTLPENSLGRLYYESIMSLASVDDNLLNKEYRSDLEDKLQAEIKSGNASPTTMMVQEITYQHDLMHLITNSPTSLDGEGKLHAFLIPHLRIPATHIIALSVCLGDSFKLASLVPIKEGWKAYQRGKRAKWLFPVKWVDYLDKDIDDIRKEFNVEIANESAA